MSRRKTVGINIEKVEMLIKEKGWSSSIFCTLMMNKQRGWVAEWKRGKNFPSPNEAATICSIFGVRPEEIIVDAEDCTIVSEILAKTEKAPVPETNTEAKYMMELFTQLEGDRRKRAVAYLLELSQEEAGGKT